MTQHDTSAQPAGTARPAKYRGRHLPMVAVVIAAFIATALAYSGMVLFGLEVAGMAPMEAYALAGFLEVSLVAVALMARNAALEARPYGVLLTLTWVLSGTSGLFAALHEVAVPSATTPYMVVFRFIPPLVAALMWHLALVGERHLVTGDTLDERRRERRVHAYVTALEKWRDARLDSTGDRKSTRKVRTAHQAQRSARDGALKLLTVEDFERRMQVWVQRLEAAERHGSRLDLIGASSVKRGMTPGVAEVARPQAQPEPELTRPTATHEEPETRAERDAVEDSTETTSTERYADVSITALLADAKADERSERATDPVQHAAPAPTPVTPDESTAPVPYDERLPETGHTRRVEIFDLVNRPEWARRAAGSAEGSTAGTATPDESSADVSTLSARDQRILALAGDGVAHKDIAREVDASRSTVSRVVRRHGAQSSTTDEAREFARV
ncbi:DMT family transporter [Paraoerskovia marina]|uniref:DMT family transporter n=1 Tax=Paraoerskovia marina TaxID=545619 RepID=UPI0012DD79ED|nr:DMT family transporter [Paraoerskovia marina]